MSSEHVIRVEGVTKVFPVYDKPSHRLLQMLSPGRSKHRWFREFRALHDVSLEVRRGETLGIVGRNGSGKSTLLQIICGTLQPSVGDVHVSGRVAALLELGAGFNPDFTGRENVFLYGTVLGLTRREIEQRFDEIAAFADIGEFMEQPVKNYSSGMYVRLAFAVAVNVTPDILVVDEALSVGDEAFQRKCFARIDRIRDEGATVLFVSHSAGIVTQLCDRAVLLDHGELLVGGSPKFVVSRYHKLLYAPPERLQGLRMAIAQEMSDADERCDKGGGEDDADLLPSDRDDAQLVKSSRERPFSEEGEDSHGWFDEGLVPKSTVRYDTRGALIGKPHLETPAGRKVNVLRAGDEYVYVYRVKFTEAMKRVRFGMLIKTLTGLDLGGGASSLPDQSLDVVEAGCEIEARFRFRCMLDSGVYFLNAGVLARLGEEETYVDRLIDAAMFRVMPQPERLGTGIVDFGVRPQVDMVESKEAGA
ncbi:ABC transporter ATP-binding protein [Oleiagrimonas soli]|uniref:ABC transporter ATP-binding protein n=1 Tax=Oleiagrimonas soli TaxID=1543381 RepID=A0A099CX21_9GAMM|nr:ABC transporter ATP-binding protein [Oleiagrimonas soli]KGI78503.1 ABC transporter ATP-binding protein [Oleiagrimonas soli]MBB6184239.1 lipopolysaccharide transport system ATP-binding protein [Oleiagrimonas soli]